MFGILLICCASVSSGFSGKPSGEWLAEWKAMHPVNMARICQPLSAVVDELPNGALMAVNLDGSYWDSYANDCTAGIEAVRTFYRKTTSAQVVIATVPDRNAGWLLRGVCGAMTREQSCRTELNASITKGCGSKCLLVDSDDIFRRYESGAEDTLHLTPDVWKEVATEIMTRIEQRN